MILATLTLALAAPLPAVEVGDIVFQQSTSQQSAQIQRATQSRYSHVAIVIESGEAPAVLEAVQPVRRTPLAEWIDRGVDDHVVVRRPVIAPTPAQQLELTHTGMQWIGRDYDASFRWDDTRLYCSELVYKLYAAVMGIEVGVLRPVSDFHVNTPEVRAALAQRGIALTQRVVSPADILSDSDLFDPLQSDLSNTCDPRKL